MSERRVPPSRDLVALVLAFGLVVTLAMLVFAVVWDALFHSDPGLSENSTQVLLSTFGGIIGLLGGYIGGKAVGEAHERERQERNGEHLSDE